MRLVTFQKCNTNRLGALVGDKVIDLNLAYAKQLCKEGDPSPGSSGRPFAVRYEAFSHERREGYGSCP